VAVHDDDRLHAELDRQLAEVRAACDGLATRSGLLVAAIAAVAAVLAPRINPGNHWVLLVLTAVALGLATLSAVGTLMPWLKVGPVTTWLASWMSGGSSATTSSELYVSKATILAANLNRLLVMRTLFAVQAITTISAVGLALWYTASR
jgi:hypothetical protein